MKLTGHLLILCLLLVSAVQAASITTIQLQNRPAEEVIPIIEPMLGPGEVITGQGFKLFLRASPETLEQVEEIVAALDTAPNMLQISVFQGSKRKLKKLNVSGSLQIEGDNASVGVGSQAGDGAGNINYNSGDTSASASGTSTQLRQQDSPVHRLRVAEGTEGFIQTGEQRPYSVGDDGTVFKNVTTGFYVKPRIHGDSVTLQVRPFKNSVANSSSGSIETQSANTTITGRIGEWLKIGGVTEHSSSTQSGTLSYSSSKSSRKDRIWIRADLVQ